MPVLQQLTLILTLNVSVSRCEDFATKKQRRRKNDKTGLFRWLYALYNVKNWNDL